MCSTHVHIRSARSVRTYVLQTAQVRVCRAEMAAGVVVKEMSEAAVLSRLAKELAAVEAGRTRSR